MAVNRMLSKNEEQRSFSNGPLRDQWEKRAQSMADQCKEESERREKSALKGLYSKWTYHWSLGSNGDMSEFSRITNKKDDENNKPKIKFKIVPPPPKPKPEPPPPPPPPRRKASPKPHRPKRKVEVDVFRLCWKESWMSLKPPKYLYLKARELRNTISEFAAIQMTDNGKYKAKRYSSVAELMSPQDKWILSWKQVKGPAQMKRYEGNPFQWETLCERQLVWEADIEKYSLPVWAGTWKIMNFAFRQQKQKWDQVWPENFPKKPERCQQLETQDELPRWGCSWKLSGPDLEFPTTPDNEPWIPASGSGSTVTLIDDVFLPDWRDSWLLSAAPPEEEAERRQNWGCSWGYRQQIRWRKASLTSHHQHSDMLTKRRITTSLFLMSQLDDEVPDVMEWMEAWITPKRCAETEEDEEQEEEEEEVKEAGLVKDGREDMDEVDNIETWDEEEKDEGVDEEEEEGEEKEDEEEVEEEEENEGLEYVDKNEEDNTERSGRVQKKDPDNRQLDITKLDKEDEEDKEEEDEGVDEEEEEDEEDEVSEKEEDTDVIEEDKKVEEKDNEKKTQDSDEDTDEEDRNKVQIQEDEEEEQKELDEEEDSEQNDKEEDIDEEARNEVQIEEDEEEEEKELEEEEESEQNEEEEEEKVEDKEVEEKVNNINKGCEEEEEGYDEEHLDVEETDEGEDEESNVEVKNNTDEEEEENDMEAKAHEEHGRDFKKMDEEHEEEGETDEEESVKVDDEDDDEVNEEAENRAVEQQNEKNKQRQVKCKPDTPLHLQFHKLKATFSSWRRSWMVAVAHRGGQDGEEEDQEEKQDWWAWRESWRIYRWKKPDEDEVVSFSTEHRFQRHVGLTREADALPRPEWATSWKMKRREAEPDTS